MEFEGNVINLFNQRAVLGVYENMIPTSLVNPTPRSPLLGRSADGLGQGDERLQLHRCAERHRSFRRACSPN